ncbi:hypothetical protein Nmar_1434 [Nitrosopumilus maritimus SCM1]|uniref:Uncharacterized protein n=2 Tax=Nitrosopumilus maritimus TaxID=338192 RepID=A9A3R8_NITMS|nr:hypothetical protein Nmar_1434 [Nitrosopumilus maritimus SCM1]
MKTEMKIKITIISGIILAAILFAGFSSSFMFPSPTCPAGTILKNDVCVIDDPATGLLVEKNEQCDIPYDENFLKRRAINASIAAEFSIYSTVTIDTYSVENDTHSLILKPVPTSYGYITMCNPLPVLEQRFDTKLDSLAILVDGVEIPYEMRNNVLRIDVNNNAIIEIVGFSKI